MDVIVWLHMILFQMGPSVWSASINLITSDIGHFLYLQGRDQTWNNDDAHAKCRWTVAWRTHLPGCTSSYLSVPACTARNWRFLQNQYQLLYNIVQSKLIWKLISGRLSSIDRTQMSPIADYLTTIYLMCDMGDMWLLTNMPYPQVDSFITCP